MLTEAKKFFSDFVQKQIFTINFTFKYENPSLTQVFYFNLNTKQTTRLAHFVLLKKIF